MRRDRNWLVPPESILTRVEVGRLRAYALSGVLSPYREPVEICGDFTGFWSGLPLAETEMSRRDQHRLVFQRRRAWVQGVGDADDGGQP